MASTHHMLVLIALVLQTSLVQASSEDWKIVNRVTLQVTSSQKVYPYRT